MLKWFRKTPAAPPSPVAAVPGPLEQSIAIRSRGAGHFERGEFDEAARCFKEALVLDPSSAAACFNLGLVLRAQGRLPEAADAFHQAWQADESMADALQLLGAIRQEQGDLPAAAGYLRQALAADPALDGVHGDLCLALFQQGEVDEAARVMADGIARHPGNAGYHAFEGNLFVHRKQPADAVQSYRRALALDGSQPGFHHNLGIALQAVEAHEEAVQSFDQALALNPDYPDAHKSRGVALMSLQRHAEALQAHERALALDAGDAGAHFNRAVALTALRRHDDADAAFARALALDDSRAEVHNSRGLLLSDRLRYAEALACFDRALQLEPGHADALANRAMTLGHLDRREEQAGAFERLLEAEPDYPYGIGFLLSSRMYACDWRGREALVARAAEAISAGRRAVVPFSWLAMQGSAQSQLECSRIYAADKYPPQRRALWRGERYAHGKIRIAYLSADLHNHATAYLMAELFELHDRERFETTALSFGPDTPGEMRSRLKRAFTQFVDVRSRSDDEIAQLMRGMEIDIAVDLKGFTTDARMGIFTRRAAPVQVSWIGYPGTLGSACMDYIIADGQVASPDVERWYSEKLVYLPDSYQCNYSQRRIAPETPTRAQQGLPESAFVFCCFNNNYKITPEVFSIWMRLLQKVPGSVLWLLQDNELAARNLRAEAAQRGVAPERLVFAPRAPLDAHLARHRLADLFLDTLPYNAHTTASDALWAGLPVLTCKGEAFASRVAASLLHATGLPELVTHSHAEYEAKALQMASSPSMLAAIRKQLADNCHTAPLFDTPRMVRHLESAYTTMWERSQRGEGPHTIKAGSAICSICSSSICTCPCQ